MTWELLMAAALGHFIEVWGATIVDAVARALIRIIDGIAPPMSTDVNSGITQIISDPRVDVLTVALENIGNQELKVALLKSVDNIMTQRTSKTA